MIVFAKLRKIVEILAIKGEKMKNDLKIKELF